MYKRETVIIDLLQAQTSVQSDVCFEDEVVVGICYDDETKAVSNVTIFQSYKIKKNTDKIFVVGEILSRIERLGLKYSRKETDMVHEISAHNLIYRFGLFKERTRDADLEEKQRWWLRIMYFIIGGIFKNA